MDNNRPGVGVTVLVFSKEKINYVLMGKRLNKTGYGMYAFPGGHVEFGESFIQTAIREVKEETKLDIENVELIKILNCIDKVNNYHYIVPVLKGYSKDDKLLQNMEPNKCEGWKWYNWNNKSTFPSPLFYPLEQLIKYK
jgi:8-oxo-dGTP diphosphatase